MSKKLFYLGFLVDDNALNNKLSKGVSDWSMTEKLVRNKRNALAFYYLLFNHKNPFEAINKYVGDA